MICHIDRSSIIRTPHFKMEMWCSRGAAIPHLTDKLSHLYRKFLRFQNNIDIKTLILILPFLHKLCYLRSKLVHMTIYRYCSIRMGDIETITISCGCYGNSGDIAITNGIDRFTHYSSHSEIETCVKSTTSQLPISSGK